MPGGGILLGESINETAKRVAKEELGLDIDLLKNLGYIEFHQDREGYKHAISMVFLAKPKLNNIKLNEQAIEFGVFNKIPKDTILEQAQFLKEFLIKNNKL